jgi:hypothetical protein
MNSHVLQSFFILIGSVLLATLPRDVCESAYRAQSGIAMLVIGIGVGVGVGLWLASRRTP